MRTPPTKLQQHIVIILYALPLLYLTYVINMSKDFQPPHVASSEYKELNETGMHYISEKMPEKSIPLLQKAIALQPEQPSAYNNLCVAYTLLKHYKKGIDYCKKAIALDADFQLAKNNLQWAMDELANPAGAN